MPKTKCELCSLANMTDALRRAPGRPQAREIRLRLARMKSYESGVTGLCEGHEGHQRIGSARMIEHWVERIENNLDRRVRR